MSEPSMQIVRAMKQKCDVETISVLDFLKEQQACWGSPSWNVLELLQHGMIVTPYFDYDEEMISSPNSAQIALIRQRCLDAVTAIFQEDSKFSADRHVKVGYRHGFLKSGKFKISFRIWVRTYSILMEDMPGLIEAHGDKDFWDTSVYSSTRKMGVPGACKGYGDTRVLELEEGVDPKLAIIQYLEGTETLLKASQRTRQRPPTDASCPDWEKLEQLLLDFGFKDPYYVGSRSKSITFKSADIGVTCPCCPHTHDNNNYWALEQPDGRILVKNYSDRCTQVMLGEAKYMFGDNAIEEMRTYTNQALKAVEGLGSLLTRVTGSCVDTSSVVQTSYGFDFNTEDNGLCAGCGKVHGDNPWRCDTLVLPCYQVTCQVPGCKPSVVGMEQSPVLWSLVKNPQGDTAFVDMFRMQQLFHGYQWVNDGSKWYRFDGNLWRLSQTKDFTKELHQVATPALQTLVKHLADKKSDIDLGQLEDGGPKVGMLYKNLTAAHNYLQKKSGLMSIVDTAACTTMFDNTFAQKLDTNLDVAGAPNGVICLKTGKLLEGAADQYVSKQVGAVYLGLNHPTPDIDAFFKNVFNGDEEVIAYLQRYMGYFLTGHTKEQSFAIFWGTGSNSKSVLADLLRLTFGEYFRNMARDCLFASDRRASTNAATPHLAELDKVRLGVVEESKDTDVLDTALIKQVTGSSQLNCRMLHQNNQVIDITHKPLLLTNYKPRIDVDDEAILRRLLVVPFLNVYKSQKDLDPQNPHHRLMDPHLKDKLLAPAVLSQFLTWLVRGAVMWYTAGLGEKPQLMQEAEQKYIGENDDVSTFISAHCELGKAYRVETRVFKEAYEQQTDTKIKADVLIKKMKSRGFVPSKKRLTPGSSPTNTYTGLRLSL